MRFRYIGLLLLLIFSASFLVNAQDVPVTNNDIIKMSKAGVSRTNIINLITNSSKVDFSLTPDDLIRLKEAGVDDDVVSKMFEAKRNVAPSTTEPARVRPAADLPKVTPPSQSPATGGGGASGDSSGRRTDVIRPVAPRAPAGVRSRATAPRTSTAARPQNPDQPVDPICFKALVLDRAKSLDQMSSDFYNRNICDIVRVAIAQGPPEILPDRANTQLMNLFVSRIIKDKKLFTTDAEKSAAASNLFLESDKARTDKQVGGGPSSAGSTSLAVRGGAPSIIGWAVEHGGATSSINGNTVTVRVNPFGLMRALQGQGFLGSDFMSNLTNGSPGSSGSQDLAFSNALRKFSTSFSFDTTRGQATPTFIISKQQLSAFSLRYEFINQRNPQSGRGQKLFRDFVAANTANFSRMVDIAIQLKDNNGNYTNQTLADWLILTNREIQAIPNPATQRLSDIKNLSVLSNAKIQAIRQLLGVDDDKLQGVLNLLTINDDRVNQIMSIIDPVAQRNYEEAVRGVIEKNIASISVDELLKDTVLKQDFETFVELTIDYDKKRKNFIEEINKGSIATFEYTNNREPIAPDTSNFRFIWENGRFLKNTDFTLNASLTMYNKRPVFAGVKRIRDFQFALQTDTSLGNTFGTGNTILTFAGKYERLNGDTIDALGIVKPNTKGDTAVGQFKYTIPIADWGIKLPISITFANRSDLIKESTIRANFGFTFDLDPIFARFKPF